MYSHTEFAEIIIPFFPHYLRNVLNKRKNCSCVYLSTFALIFLTNLTNFFTATIKKWSYKRQNCFPEHVPPHHLVWIVLDYFNEQFPNRWTGHGLRRLWVPRSLDLTPLDIFVCGVYEFECVRSEDPHNWRTKATNNWFRNTNSTTYACSCLLRHPIKLVPMIRLTR